MPDVPVSTAGVYRVIVAEQPTRTFVVFVHTVGRPLRRVRFGEFGFLVPNDLRGAHNPELKKRIDTRYTSSTRLY